MLPKGAGSYLVKVTIITAGKILALNINELVHELLSMVQCQSSLGSFLFPSCSTIVKVIKPSNS